MFNATSGPEAPTGLPSTPLLNAKCRRCERRLAGFHGSGRRSTFRFVILKVPPGYVL